MMRIGLFMLTNLAVMVIMGIITSIFDISGQFGESGINYTAMMVSCFCYGMVASAISLFLSKTMAKRSMRVKVIDSPSNHTEKWLVDTIAKQADAVNIGMPEVGIFNSPQPNAFATGWNKNKALVAVSTGLLQVMSQDEVEAVLAHEIGHVANGDMVTLALIQGVVNAFVMFFSRIIGRLVDQVVFKNNSNRPGIGYFLTSTLLNIAFGFLATIIVRWFSRRREFRADAMGAKLAGTQNMINALDALRPASQKPDSMPANMQAFAISTGKLKGAGVKNMFRTHPSLDDRIAALSRLSE